MKRALRRHQAEVQYQRARRFIRDVWQWNAAWINGRSVERLFWRSDESPQEVIHIHARTRAKAMRKMCSSCCGNRRKWDGPTLQERRYSDDPRMVWIEYVEGEREDYLNAVDDWDWDDDWYDESETAA